VKLPPPPPERPPLSRFATRMLALPARTSASNFVNATAKLSIICVVAVAKLAALASRAAPLRYLIKLDRLRIIERQPGHPAGEGRVGAAG
jgi:hypothetical protein